MNTPPASTETVAAARLLLTQMGISPTDLVTVGATVPTFAEIVPRVRETLKAGTKRTYGTHLDRLEQQWPDRHLDQVGKPDLDEMARAIQLGARVNRASRGGASAVEHFISAVRCVYRYAEDHGWIRPCDNPARQLTIPVRRPSHRYAIPSGQLAEICRTAATTGDDPELDALILHLHIETACRRGSALALRPHCWRRPGLSRSRLLCVVFVATAESFGVVATRMRCGKLVSIAIGAALRSGPTRQRRIFLPGRLSRRSSSGGSCGTPVATPTPEIRHREADRTHPADQTRHPYPGTPRIPHAALTLET